jgi:hypothetical protein
VLAGLAAATTALALPAQPAAAEGTANLSVALRADPATPGAGHQVSYRIEVHNQGGTTATQVQIDFTTSAALVSPTAAVSAGRCLRSPAETACLFGTVKAGGNAWATISGKLPKTIAPGTLVHNKVVLASDTTLSDPAGAEATADYATPGKGKPSTKPKASSGTSATAHPTALVASPDDGGGLLVPSALAGVAGLVIALVAVLLWRRSRRAGVT